MRRFQKIALKPLNILGLVVAVIMVSYFLWLVFHIATNLLTQMWDFRVYYFAAKAFVLGLNPYGTEVISQVANQTIVLPFVYPPVALLAFAPLTFLKYEFAAYLFLLLKMLATFGLIWLWWRYLLPDGKRPWLLILLLLLGFNAALYTDFLTGNISIFEQLFLWIALAAFVYKRYPLFCVGILLVSLFKITPLMFLGLLLFVPGRQKWIWMISTLALFAAIMGLSALLQPELFAGFRGASVGLDERGVINPATLPFIQDFFEIHYKLPRLDEAVTLVVAVFYGIVCLIVLLLFLFATHKLNLENKRDRIYWICLAVVAYTLILPRFKNYSYIILILPAYVFALSWKSIKPGAVLLPFIILAFTDRSHTVLATQTFFEVGKGYYSLFVAAVMFGLAVTESSMNSKFSDKSQATAGRSLTSETAERS